MAFKFATVPPQPTLLEAKGEVLDQNNPIISPEPEEGPSSPLTASEVVARALTSSGLATPEVTMGCGGQDIALAEADPFRAVPGLQEPNSIEKLNSIFTKN